MQADLRRSMWDWHLKLKQGLSHRRDQEHFPSRERSRDNDSKNTTSPGAIVSPYLHLVQAGRLSPVTILEVMRLQGTGGVHQGMKGTRALVEQSTRHKCVGRAGSR